MVSNGFLSNSKHSATIFIGITPTKISRIGSKISKIRSQRFKVWVRWPGSQNNKLFWRRSPYKRSWRLFVSKNSRISPGIRLDRPQFYRDLDWPYSRRIVRSPKILRATRMLLLGPHGDRARTGSHPIPAGPILPTNHQFEVFHHSRPTDHRKTTGFGHDPHTNRPDRSSRATPIATKYSVYIVRCKFG